MYRIMCNSLMNYTESFNDDDNDARYRQILFLRLIEDIDEYEHHKKTDSEQYRSLSQFLYIISDCERCENILHELDVLGIEAKDYGDNFDFTDVHSIWHAMLKLGYWNDETT